MTRSAIYSSLGISLTAIGGICAAALAPLSANEIISVTTEAEAYWLVLLLVLACGWLYLKNQPNTISVPNFFFKTASIIVFLLIVIICWKFSDGRFLTWKMRAIPSQAWSGMVSDLCNAVIRESKSGSRDLYISDLQTQNLKLLGLPEDYTMGIRKEVQTHDYRGNIACVIFGHRVRRWGLAIGPKSVAEEYCPGGNYFPVASNAYFFFGKDHD